MNAKTIRISILLLCLRAGLACAGACPPIWSGDFGPNAIDGYVVAVTTANLDGRHGEEIVFVGEQFSTVPGTAAANIAMWNGTSWHPLEEGLNDVVLSLVEFDEDADGLSPPLLFAAGYFGFAKDSLDNFIARWDGTRWSSVGGGLTDSRGFGFVSSMVVFDPDDSGPTLPALYVTGWFDHAGGTPAHGCAKWDGKSWSAVDAGVVPYQALQVIDFDGPGPNLPELLGASYFSSAEVNGGVIVRWNGYKWEMLKGVFDGAVYSLAGVNLDGGGPNGATLFAGGSFDSVDGAAVHGIAQWTGTGWSDLSGGLRHDPFFQPDASALLSFDPDGPGPSSPLLVVGGAFATDIDRSGATAPADILKEVDLLNGGWSGRGLPTQPDAWIADVRTPLGLIGIPAPGEYQVTVCRNAEGPTTLTVPLGVTIGDPPVTDNTLETAVLDRSTCQTKSIFVPTPAVQFSCNETYTSELRACANLAMDANPNNNCKTSLVEIAPAFFDLDYTVLADTDQACINEQVC